MQDELSPELRELGEIIRAYSAVTDELQQSHTLLQGQVAQLTGELREKNRELSETVTEVSSLKNFLAGIIDSSADGIIAVDLDRRITAWNPAANAVAGIWGDVPENPEGMFLLDVLRGPCREFGLMLMRSLSDDQRLSGIDIRLLDPSGRMRYFSASASPVRHTMENGETGRVGAVQIFSEQTEMRELEDRANRQDRLAALGEMAAGVAHEIRNPLGGIELYASNLRRKFADGSAENATCGKIIAAAASLNRIVTDMLTFTRSRQPQLRRASVLHVVRTAADMAANELSERNISLTVDIDDSVGTWLMDPDQIAQAALNVILNAAQAMGRDGSIDVSAREDGLPGGGRGLCIRFSDVGPGIPDSAKTKIFDPFFTLRKDGTGLGLAIVNKILQDHGGSIEVADNQPKGTVVSFRLPE
jgi:PAS domain S-box